MMFWYFVQYSSPMKIHFPGIFSFEFHDFGGKQSLLGVFIQLQEQEAVTKKTLLNPGKAGEPGLLQLKV